MEAGMARSARSPLSLSLFPKRSENPSLMFELLNFKCWQLMHFVFKHVEGGYCVPQTKHDLGPLWPDNHLLNDLV